MPRHSSLRGLLLGGAISFAAVAAVSLGGLLAMAVSMQREVVSRTMLLVQDQSTAQQVVIAVQGQLLTAKSYLVSPRPELAVAFQERGRSAYEGIRYYLFRDLQPAERLQVEEIKERHALIEVLAMDAFALADQGRIADAQVQSDALLAHADSLEVSIARLQETRRAETDRLLERHAAQANRMYSAGAAVALLLLLAVALLAGFLRRRLLEPLQALSAAAHRLGRGELDARLEVGTLDELGEVACSFNTMAGDLEQASARAVAAEAHYRHLVVHAPTCIYSVDAAGVIRDVNPAGEAIFARSRAQIVGLRLADLVVAEDAHVSAGAMARLASGESQTVQFGVRLPAPAGEPASVHVIMASLSDGQTISGAHGILLDLSARKRAEMELVRAKDAAEAANQAKSEFLSSMSHELRTPLNSVIGFASVLGKNRGGNLSPQELMYIDRIHANGGHLLGLINDVLDLAKIEAGRMDVELRPTSLGDLVAETLEELAVAVSGKPVVLRAVIPDGLALHETDPAKLKQVLINLIGNAIKFTEAGAVTVSVAAEPGSGRPLRLSVSDTGVGIKRDRLSAIFNAFEQAETGTGRRYGGTGLGLAISDSLCGLLGDRLVVDSEPGAGSIFTIVLGAAGHAATEPPPAAPATSLGGGDGPERDARARQVLVIDDEADARILLTHHLEDLGCRVVAAASGPDGLRMAREVPPDLITLDLRLPGMSGWHVLQALKGDPRLCDVPVVIVSVIAGESRGTVIGAVDLIDKPVERDRLRSVLDRHLAPGTGRVVVVDADAEARARVAGLLRDEGIEARTAAGAGEALRLLNEHPADVVVVDVNAAGADEFALLHRLRAAPAHRHVPVVVVAARPLTPDEDRQLCRMADAVVHAGESLETALAEMIRRTCTGRGALPPDPARAAAHTAA